MNDPQTVPPPGPCVMVIDDTAQNLRVLSEVLKDAGYRTRPFRSGSHALRAAREEPPDLVLLDILMPEMDGYEICARLKAEPELADVPVIFISALSEGLDKDKAFSSGGVDYVTKPFQPMEVQARVRTHLRLRRLQRKLVDQNRELQDSYRQLQELEGLRDNLVKMMVHDMRSPLMGILGYLELGAPGRPLATDERLWSNAREACADLTRLIDDLLDVSRIEAGKLPLSIEEAPVADVIDAALAPLQPALRGRRAVLDVQPSLRARFDRSLVGRVVTNLVSNALHFSPDDGEIRLSARGGDEGARIEVSDQGPGVPPELHERIFEKFGQAGQTRRHSSGLGLAFCKLAVEAQEGRIGVTSRGDDTGSTFWFTLPPPAAG